MIIICLDLEMATLHLPLEQRVFKSKRAGKATFEQKFHSRPTTYGQWEQESLDAAVAAVEVDGVSIRRAAMLYSVPKSTLYDHVSGRVDRQAKPGPKPYLSLAEEEELVNFLLKCARIGYPHTRQQIIGIVQQALAKKFDQPPSVTNGWWERFVNRHVNLSLRTPAPLSFIRAMAMDRECLDQYFDLLKVTLEENDLFDKATCIFNCDETGFPLCPKGEKVLCERGAKNPCNLTGNNKTQITVLGCASASGYSLPPFVCFDRKNLNLKLTEGELPGTVYGLSSNGWMNSDLFSEWFKGHFLYHAPASRPLLLLLDGHKSHYCPEFICEAAAEGVIVFALPPNTTHISQPLDKGPFSPLKSYWRKIVHDFTLKTQKAVTRYDFSKLLSDAWNQAMTLKNIISGFKTTGICPYNRNAVIPEEKVSKFQPAASTGIKFIPILSATIESPSPRVNVSSAPGRATQQSGELSPSDFVEDLDSDISMAASTCESTDFTHTPQCLDLTDSDAPKRDGCYLALKRGRVLTKFVSTPRPPSKIPVKNKRSCGRVLTSREQVRIIEEKAKKKEQLEREKEERKKKREEAKKVRDEKRLIAEERRVQKRIQGTKTRKGRLIEITDRRELLLWCVLFSGSTVF